jgi:hypothetical protein
LGDGGWGTADGDGPSTYRLPAPHSLLHHKQLPGPLLRRQGGRRAGEGRGQGGGRAGRHNRQRREPNRSACVLQNGR